MGDNVTTAAGAIASDNIGGAHYQRIKVTFGDDGGCVNNTAIVKSAAFMDYEVPDGLEMNGDGTATFGFTLETPDWVTTTATGRAKITAIGFEY